MIVMSFCRLLRLYVCPSQVSTLYQIFGARCPWPCRDQFVILWSSAMPYISVLPVLRMTICLLVCIPEGQRYSLTRLAACCLVASVSGPDSLASGRGGEVVILDCRVSLFVTAYGISAAANES